jgi:hypothetical protein
VATTGPGFTETITVPLLWSRRWFFTLSPAGSAVTALRYRRRPNGASPWESWTSVTTGLPADGGSLAIEPDSAAQCAETLQVEVTTAGAATVSYGYAGA